MSEKKESPDESPERPSKIDGPDSPQDKRLRAESESSLESPRQGQADGLPFMVSASPPKFVSMEEIMTAAKGVSNLTLAHEIAVDNDFQISPRELPENSFMKQVKDTMHRAFWDTLSEKLKEDPPDLSHAVVLLQEVKEKVIDLLLPQHQKIRQQIDEVLDVELIEQQADNGALDFLHYATFIIDLLAKICAPIRDEQVAKLRDIQEIVPLYREMFAVLDVMKLDMANFTIQQMRPFIQQQSTQYERIKFTEFLNKQKENNIDGLKFTKDWLQKNFHQLHKEKSELPAAAEASAATGTNVSPNAVLNESYLELLRWDFDNRVFPETVLMDEGRLITISQRVKWLALVSSTLLVTYNTGGGPLAGIQSLKMTLRDQMESILAGVPEGQLPEAMKNVASQVIKEVQQCLDKHGFSALDEARQEMLRGQIEALADPKHMVQQVMRSRIIGFLRSIISTSHPSSVQVPPGLSAVSDELSKTCSAFMRVINHNRNVFGSYYAEILQALMKVTDEQKMEMSK